MKRGVVSVALCVTLLFSLISPALAAKAAPSGEPVGPEDGTFPLEGYLRYSALEYASYYGLPVRLYFTAPVYSASGAPAYILGSPTTASAVRRASEYFPGSVSLVYSGVYDMELIPSGDGYRLAFKGTAPAPFYSGVWSNYFFSYPDSFTTVYHTEFPTVEQLLPLVPDFADVLELAGPAGIAILYMGEVAKTAETWSLKTGDAISPALVLQIDFPDGTYATCPYSVTTVSGAPTYSTYDTWLGPSSGAGSASFPCLATASSSQSVKRIGTRGTSNGQNRGLTNWYAGNSSVSTANSSYSLEYPTCSTPLSASTAYAVDANGSSGGLLRGVNPNMLVFGGYSGPPIESASAWGYTTTDEISDPLNYWFTPGSALVLADDVNLFVPEDYVPGTAGGGGSGCGCEPYFLSLLAFFQSWGSWATSADINGLSLTLNSSFSDITASLSDISASLTGFFDWFKLAVETGDFNISVDISGNDVLNEYNRDVDVSNVWNTTFSFIKDGSLNFDFVFNFVTLNVPLKLGLPTFNIGEFFNLFTTDGTYNFFSSSVDADLGTVS